MAQNLGASRFHWLLAYFRQLFSGQGFEVEGFHVLGNQKADQIDDAQVEFLGKPANVVPVVLPDVYGVVAGPPGSLLSTGVIDTVETRHNGLRWGRGENLHIP